MRTEPRTHTFILTFMFGALCILGTFQNATYGYTLVIGSIGIGLILGSIIQDRFPNALRQTYGGGKIEDN